MKRRETQQGFYGIIDSDGCTYENHEAAVNEIHNHHKKFSYAVIKTKILETFRQNGSVLGACACVNTRRLFYLSLIAMPLRVVNIALFAKSYDLVHLKLWSRGIIAAHFILLIVLFVFFLVSFKLRKRAEPTNAMRALQYIAVGTFMASGIAFVTFDQLVTTNITPFLLTCIVCGLVFLIRPLFSFIIYLASYLTYYCLIGLTTAGQEVLLSNRVNGITAVGIGFFLSVILWHYNYTSITQQRRIEAQQKQLEQMAYSDLLTGLPNRRYLEMIIQRDYASMGSSGQETAIIMLDIDDFKTINDTYGHPVGDNVLKHLAELLKSNTGEADTVSRFGGEEFIILMPNTDLEGGYRFAERLRKRIAEETIFPGALALKITASFGVASLRDMSADTEYYYQVDKALYLAKQRGKNRVEMVAPCESAPHQGRERPGPSRAGTAGLSV